MPAHFPPGAIPSRPRRAPTTDTPPDRTAARCPVADLPRRSHWRETQLMLELLVQALLPAPSLAESLAHWPKLIRHLREPPRRRQLQTDRIRQHLFHDG